MHIGVVSIGVILVSFSIIVCVSTNPVEYSLNKPSSPQEHLLHLAKVFNTLRRLELGGKGTNTRRYKHGRTGGNRNRESYNKLEAAADSKTKQNDQNEAEKFKNLESYLMRNKDNGDGLAKRQGSWDYDYGLGGGRFGKRTGDYGIGGGRFGRDVSDVDHVDLADVE